MKDRPDYTANILLELNTDNLQLYYLRAKKDIDDFLDVFNLEVTEEINDSLLDPEGKHPMWEVFMEICFIHRLKAAKVQKYYKFLKKREKDIEKVVDKHFGLLRKPLIELRKAEFEKERKAKREQGYSQSIKQQVAEKNAQNKQLRDLKDQYKSMKCEDKMDLLVKNYDVLIKADKS